MSAPPPPYPGADEKGSEPQGYPPQQQGYPPQQQGYPPQQQGYPPQQQGYPPQQQGYPPQQQGYPPQQQGYPPQQQGGYPQGPVAYQQPGYPGGYPQGHTTVVVSAQPTLLHQRFHSNPLNMVCPSCQKQVVTGITYETGALTWLLCLGLAFVGLFWGCCLIPFCIDGCKDVVHQCPGCHNVLGRYKRL